MGVAMKQFIDRFKAMEKIANETLAENPEALVGVDSFPGSEHDAKVPEDAKKPDEEVAQGQPAGAASTAGAVNGGDAKPLNEGKLEIDQPLSNPEQKPLVTDDALSAKTADAHSLASLVNDILADIKGGAQKQAALNRKQEKEMRPTIKLDEDTLNKLAAVQATFMAGRSAAESVMKKASEDPAVVARRLIKDACVKAAQDQGLDPAAAEAAAENAMAAAGAAPAEAAPAEAPAGAEAALPEDVTEEELATAIVDLVSSGELDPGTAKALVEEIAGSPDAEAPTEDQAAEIIAQGIESGEITPEQAQEIAAAVEGGGDAAAAEAPADAEAQGAADAAAALADAQDEAQGAADAEAALKTAAALNRKNAIEKVAAAVVSNRAASKAAEKPGARIMSKVASILDAKKQAQPDSDDERYIAGFKKKAEELGVDPSALARYVCERQAE